MEKPIATQDVDLRIARELSSKTCLETEYIPITDRPLQLLEKSKSNFFKKLPSVDIEFSHDSKFILAKSSSNHICWIWDVNKLTLKTILLHQKPLTATIWSPSGEKLTSLTILTNDGGLHIWSPDGVLCLALPPLDRDYGKIKSLQWNPLGRALAMTCLDGVVCCRVGK